MPQTPARRLAALVAALVVTALGLSGCAAGGSAQRASGPSDPAPAGAELKPWAKLHPLADPRSYVGPSTAHLAQADIVPITKAAHPLLPATVTDAQGTQVTVASAERILALDIYGSLSATVYGLGLGAHLVGRDESTGFPAARTLPLVTGNGHQLNAESILALHPSVLLTDTTLGPWDVVLQIRAAGVPVVVVDSKRSLAGTGSLVGQVAAALGVRAEGAELAARLAGEQRQVQDQVDRVAPKDAAARLRIVFLYARGQAGVYYLFGRGSGADSLIGALEGIDVASEAGIEGFSPLSAEALVKARPDVILMMTDGLTSVGGVEGLLKLPGVVQTPAGAHRRVVDMSDYQLLSFGPLGASVVDALARALYAPADRP